MSDDLVERLREQKPASYVDPFAREAWNRDGFEAADEITRLRAEIASLRGAVAGWQPIESAPKDGAVLLFSPDDRGAEPSHWMPLPTPPAQPKDKADD